MRTWYLTNIEDSTNVKAYNDLHDLLSDVFYSDDPRVLDLIKEWINEIYSPVEVPGIGKVNMGEVMWSIYNNRGYGFDGWIEDYIANFTDWINWEVELCVGENEDFECEILNYKITCG